MNRSSQKIIPFLWFDDQAEEAVEFYTSLFDNSRTGDVTHYIKDGREIHGQPEGKVMTVEFELDGYRMVALNGGPQFDFTPAISMFVVCGTEEEAERLWERLSEGGTPLMPLDKYDWSEKYGWIDDRYGLSWQIFLGRPEEVGQKIVPCLMYISEKGQAEEAMNLYTSLFDDSGIDSISRYGPGEEMPEKAVAHAQFRLNGEVLMAMDSYPIHEFTFNEAVSLLINCRDQQEVDHFWDRLSQGGEEGPCGWLKDRFGVSWQVAPVVLREMLDSPDDEKVARVTRAFMQMKKLDIQKLQEVFEG